jgi:hypothetical protein
MPGKKHIIKVRKTNAKKARKTKVQGSQGELYQQIPL